MPELPEVETTCRGLIPLLQGRIFTKVTLRRDSLRYPLPAFFAERLQGKQINSLSRRAKYILITLKDDPAVLIIHLGMSGRLRIDPVKDFQPQKHDHVIFTTDYDNNISYNDARRFGMMDLIPSSALPTHSLFKNLGFEPFDPLLTGNIFLHKLSNRQQSIKQTLLDQQVIVGIGNIYANESLWESQINPLRPAHTLSLAECKVLLKQIRLILHKAIETGGSTLRDYQHPNGQLGSFQKQFQVYNRALNPCQRFACKGVILKSFQGGRSTYFCESCQI